MPNWRRRALGLLPVLVLAGVAVGHWTYSPAGYFENLGESGWILTGIGVVAFYLIRPFVFWPLSAASIFLGYLLGFPTGVPIVLLGTLVTCLPPFVLADYFADANEYVARVADTGGSIVDRLGELRGMIAARLSPAPADGVSIGAGLAGVSGWAFALGTLIGELPWAIFYVGLGQSLRTVSPGMAQSVDPGFLLLVSACALLVIARPAYGFVSEMRR